MPVVKESSSNVSCSREVVLGEGVVAGVERPVFVSYGGRPSILKGGL